jgi:hypothetical protein
MLFRCRDGETKGAPSQGVTMRGTNAGKKPKRMLLVLSLLVASAILATLVFSRAGAAKEAPPVTEGLPTPPLPKVMAPKDTTPPANVRNLRRTDTVDQKAVLAASEPGSSGGAAAK